MQQRGGLVPAEQPLETPPCRSEAEVDHCILEGPQVVKRRSRVGGEAGERFVPFTTFRDLSNIDVIEEEEFVREEQTRILALIEANRVPFRLILGVAPWKR